MSILIACEMSGRVRDAFRSYGIDAWSCDLLPDMNDNNAYHYQCDIMEVLYRDWEAVLAFPPCTHLAVSGARYFKNKQKEQKEALDFVRLFLDHPAKYTLVENPVGIISTHIKKPSQIIQPYQFGHPESKRTCLWLKNLPLLKPTNVLPLPECGYWDNQTPSRQNKLGPSKNRATLRGLTYPNIAKAMAAQWEYLFKKEL